MSARPRGLRFLGLLPVVSSTFIAAALFAQVQPRFGVTIPMRDGVRLSADMWLPAGPGRFPVVLARTPYLKTSRIVNAPQWGAYFAKHGYAFVVEDTRGRGDSEGKFRFLFDDGADGYDTVEWLAAQPFSNGRVGMMGLSYLGAVQWLAARERPPHLAGIVPTAAPGRYLDELPFQGGAFMHGWILDFANMVSGRVDQSPNTSEDDLQRALAHRPLLTADEALGRRMPLYREFLNSPSTDYWKPLQFTPKDFARIDIPTLTVTGWYDGDQAGALFYWRGLMAQAPDRNKHFLLVGPWLHVQTLRGGSVKVGDTEFTPDSVVDIKALHLAFFDWCLKGATPRFEAPRVKLYVTGANEWRTYETYPPKEAVSRRLYLAGNRKLSWEATSGEPPDRYTYDPQKPVPAAVGDESWGEERSAIQKREDVLVYSSEPLTEPLDVIGTVSVTLEAASDARDTDFTAVLTDVSPDGRAVKLGPTTGILRARYRHGYAKEELLTPGRIERYTIDLNDIGHQFKPGHRIRLEISSSAVPMFNPNPNTGNPVATDTEWKVAHQTIYHDALHLAIVLPVLARTP